MSAPSAPLQPARLLTPAGVAVLLVCLAGLFAYFFIVRVGVAEPRGANIFFVLYARHEVPFIVLTALFALVALTLRGSGEGRMWPSHLPVPSRAGVGLLAAGVFLAGWLASSALLHQFGLSMDEYSAHFQARIFASGQLTAPVPLAWHGVTAGITPIFSTFLPESASWTTTYLPMYSAIRAAFLLAGAEWLTNPVMAAASVVLLAAVARRIWPDDAGRQWLALLLLVTSSQFLITSGTAYAMPAHLSLNLFWLWLWLRGDRGSLVALPLVGVLALGLHNPFPHALFAAPFLIGLLLARRWRMVAWTGVVYAVGSIYWLGWLETVQREAQQGGMGGLAVLFHWPTWRELVVQSMNLALVTTWQAPLVALGLAASLRRVRSLEHPLRELAYGALLTFAFYFLFPSTQGHGWGYRYVFPVLGGIMLLASDGWSRLAMELRPRAARILLASGLALILVQLPIRAREVEGTVRPFAFASMYLHALPADVVVIPAFAWWYGQDLVRNDPLFATPPIIVGAPYISGAQFGNAVAQLGDRTRVHYVSYAELARFGMLHPDSAARPRTPQ